MKYFNLITIFFIQTAFSSSITISLKDAPTKEILSYLAIETGNNIIVKDNIDSNTTLYIKQSDFNKIINQIAIINNLSIHKNDNIYMVSKEEKPLNTLDDNLNQSVPNITNIPDTSIFLKTKTIKLYHSKASKIIESITKGNGNILSEAGYLHFDDRSNQIIIKDTEKSINTISQLIKQLDMPIPQIAIEARIVTISSENLKELGVRWGLFSPTDQHHSFAGNLEGNGSVVNNLNVNFPVSNAASAVLQIAKINGRVLDLELNALERENHVEIIASPRLLTTNKQQASIKQGTEIPYAIYDKKSETTDVEFKKAVLGLEVTPQLSRNNQILLDLLVTQNAPNSQQGVNELTTIDKQELKTQVIAHHGETIVLGGVFQHLISKSENRVPILGSIPVIKHLFSQSRDKISKRELIIFVTPYIINPQSTVKIKKSAHK
ncbi:type IV pilus secretin PilQ [Otariodibacter oris]|uniref:Protein transport protein HofQ n=1 Tax=Otariodibacter oris TaxID=1032623 RepID=A0A420XJ81_9PAST|nr:type IV pilus secretin PilQ [Otariodibacter oris]QGM80421.1 secretin [Otariodibacter oris]RKR77434.1 protein transport protein HofQ [Otariodibacter oris]